MLYEVNLEEPLDFVDKFTIYISQQQKKKQPRNCKYIESLARYGSVFL
jgi:hypothetical protein